nr:alpha/beta hydrolase [Nocardia transvalensis]
MLPALRDAGEDLPAAAVLLSPLFAKWNGVPPLLIHAGTAELLLSDSERLAQVAADAGVDATLRIGDGLPHVYHTMLGTPEAAAATDEIGAFIRSHLE